MTWLDNLACAIVDQAAIQSVPDDATVLRAHLELVLRIVTEVGGYISPEDQAVLAAAREAVR